jgi:hypothetical protein
MKRAGRSETGHALAAVLVAVFLCGGLSAAVLTTSTSGQRESESELAGERAFELAEAGADWGVAQIRIRSGIVPTADSFQAIQGVGTYTVRYAQGDADGIDEDDDGTIDEADERCYSVLLSTGVSGRVSRTVQVILMKAVETPAFEGAVTINVEAPIIDFDGNSFTVDGAEHLLDGSVDGVRPPKYAISTPALVADVLTQIDAGQLDQITGLGTGASIGQSAAIDLDHIVDQAMLSAGTLIEPGTHASVNIGTTTETGVVVAYCPGDLHLSGCANGAGVLVVDGDLAISGTFTWTGIVLVRGRMTMTGGGGDKLVVGSIVVGEAVTEAGGDSSVEVSGNVTLSYSTDAVNLASGRLGVTTIASWREVASPNP